MNKIMPLLLLINTFILGQDAPAKDIAIAEELKKYTRAVWRGTEGGSLNYCYRGPDKLAPGKKYPLLFYLHGSGGRGNDNKGQLLDANGLEAFAGQEIFAKHSAYVFAGQVPKGERWVDVAWNALEHSMPPVSNSMELALEALDAFVANKEHQVDPNRIYVMGLSMGGYGTWDAIQRRPQYFAAAVPICGGGDMALAPTLVNMPIWIWHGDKDNTIKVSRSRDMAGAIKDAGGAPRYTEVQGRGHNVWLDVWAAEELWLWLFGQSK